MKSRIGFLVLLVMVAAIGIRAHANGFSRVIVFGTSLSDAGNAFVLRGGTATPPDYDVDPLLVPTVPYAIGGHHFTNGATWIEQYARSRGLAGGARPAFASEGAGTNYAVAAARARQDNLKFNLGMQVDAFLLEFGGAAPADALCVVEMGSNDIRDAFVVYSGGGNGGPVIAAAVAAISQNIQRLYLAGCRQFLVWRAPDVGKTPALRRLDALSPGAAAFATFLTQTFNTALDGAVAQLQLLPGISITRLDAFELIGDLVENGGDYGLTNVVSACLTPNVPPFRCDRPDAYLFWDGIHPSRAVHAIVALKAAEVLGQ
jgi:outer membrane lipase/esterase